ncbi:MAG: metallophosphoesterase [Clostridiales bacterium]|nr:metallophosphoesterase [Clostridiales bacterium]
MSKIMFLADLHGNMPATLALQKEIDKIRPDEIWFLGDAVGKGPENDQTLDWVRDHCDHFLAGNWDLLIAEWSHDCPPGHEDNSFYWDQLGKERIDWIESLPTEAEILISGIDFRLLHGRPVDINYHPYLSMDEFRPGFTDTKGKLHGGFICADCHTPYLREMDLGYAINTGSVGNSLGLTRCHALVIEGIPGGKEPAPLDFTFLSIPYDNKLAASIADKYPGLPRRESYKNEVLTGVYSR